MLELSRKHLAEAGETYSEHMRFALIVAGLAICAGVGCLIHAFIPALCQKTCSRTTGAVQGLFRSRGQLDEVKRECEGVLTFVFLLALSATMVLALMAAGGLTAVTGVLAILTFAVPGAYLLNNRELKRHGQEYQEAEPF